MVSASSATAAVGARQLALCGSRHVRIMPCACLPLSLCVCRQLPYSRCFSGMLQLGRWGQPPAVQVRGFSPRIDVGHVTHHHHQRCGCACLGGSLCRGVCVPAAAAGCAGSGCAFRCVHVSGWDTAACTLRVAPCSLHALCLSAPQLCVLAGSSTTRVGHRACYIGGVMAAPGHCVWLKPAA